MRIIDVIRKLIKQNKGIMVAVDIPDDISRKLTNIEISWPEGSEVLPAKEMHVTLALFEDETIVEKEKLKAIVGAVANKFGPMEGKLNGIGRFLETHKEGMGCVYLNFDCPGITEFRQALVEQLDLAGYVTKKNHGFTPHMTLAYVPLGWEINDTSNINVLNFPVMGASVFYQAEEPVMVPFGNSLGKAEWAENEHPRAADGRFGSKAGDHGAKQQSKATPAKKLREIKLQGKLTDTGSIKQGNIKPPKEIKARTHAVHGQNPEIQRLARKHFIYHMDRLVHMKQMGKLGGPLQLVANEFQARIVFDGEDPRKVFNEFLKDPIIRGRVDKEELDKFALNVRNMYYKKLRGQKLKPKPYKVKTLPRDPEKDAELCNKFRTGGILKTESLGGGGREGKLSVSSASGKEHHANAAYRISIKGDGRACMKGVSNGGEYGMPHNEVFTYQVAAALGFDVIPPTTFRQDERFNTITSVQSWQENCVVGAEIKQHSLEPTPELYDSISQLIVLDTILLNRDRHNGNWVYNKDTGRIVGIDNGLAGLDVGRGDIGSTSVAVRAYSRIWNMEEKVDSSKPGHKGYKDILRQEHLDAARNFVRSPEFEKMARSVFDHNDFHDHLTLRRINFDTYLDRIVKGAEAGLKELESHM